MKLALHYTVRSDVGLIREENEDSAFAGPHLLAIADGMGGHAAGEVASAVAISALTHLDADPAEIDAVQALADAVAEASATLREISDRDPATEGMGTTLTALLFGAEQVTICHIGDSRGYVLRDGTFYQVTHDHTLVQSLVDEGRLTREAAANHPQRSLVMRALQGSIPAEPDLAVMAVQAGDRFLLCSDGLSDVVTDETLHKTLVECTDLNEAIEQLVDLAIRSGGPDNITCVLADVIDAEASPELVSTEVVLLGSVAADDQSAVASRADSPAVRAHLLTSALRATGQSDSEPSAAVVTADQATDSGDPEPGPAQYRSALVRSVRRFPVVTAALTLLLVVLGAAGYVGWRVTQNQYFVGVANGKVAVFRGVNEPVAGLSLASVVMQTDIPVAGLPVAMASQIKNTISPLTLSQARQTIGRIRQGYQCGLDRAAIAAWLAHRPKPAPKPATKHRSKSHPTRPTTRASATAKPAYPPEPPLHAYCSQYPGVTG